MKDSLLLIAMESPSTEASSAEEEDIVEQEGAFGASNRRTQDTHPPSKRRKLTDDERLKRWFVSPFLPSLKLFFFPTCPHIHYFPFTFTVRNSRERNRKHARNTRERKKRQMDALQNKIQELTNEV